MRACSSQVKRMTPAMTPAQQHEERHRAFAGSLSILLWTEWFVYKAGCWSYHDESDGVQHEADSEWLQSNVGSRFQDGSNWKVLLWISSERRNTSNIDQPCLAFFCFVDSVFGVHLAPEIMESPPGICTETARQLAALHSRPREGPESPEKSEEFLFLSPV